MQLLLLLLLHPPSPEQERGNYPNEEFFLRPTEGRVTARQLRKEEVRRI